MICRFFLICDICDICNYITLNVELWVYSIHMSQNELKFHQWRHIKSTLVNRCSMLWLPMIYVITILWMIYGFSWITPFSSAVGWFGDALLEWTNHVWKQPTMEIIGESLQEWSWTIIHGKFFFYFLHFPMGPQRKWWKLQCCLRWVNQLWFHDMMQTITVTKLWTIVIRSIESQMVVNDQIRFTSLSSKSK